MSDLVSKLTLRQRLRALPVFPELFPDFDATEWADDPSLVFMAWLEWAMEHGVPEPHSAVVSSANREGSVSARTLILKDLKPLTGEEGPAWRFATHSDTRKARDFADNPHAAVTFYWPELGRQVIVQGSVQWLGEDVAAEDYRQRPIAGTEVDPQWRAFEVVATSVEFWQASPDRAHRRQIYTRPEPRGPFTRATGESGMA
jgi:pyridoxamine 5'-phosphate oxidase